MSKSKNINNGTIITISKFDNLYVIYFRMISKLNKKLPTDKKQINDNKQNTTSTIQKPNILEFDVTKSQQQNVYELKLKQNNKNESQIQQLQLKTIKKLIISFQQESKVKQIKLFQKKPHPNIPKIFKLIKNTKENNYTAYTQNILNYSQLNQFSSASFEFKIKIIVQILQALIYLHQNNIFMLYLNTSSIRVNKNNLRIYLDSFYKDSFPQDSPLWNSIIAPELINEKLLKNKVADYFNCDVWSLANIILQLLYSSKNRLQYSKNIQDKFYIEKEDIEQVEIDLPPLKQKQSRQIQKMIKKCLSFNPRKRMKLKQLKQYFQKILYKTEVVYNQIDNIVEIITKNKNIAQQNIEFIPQLLKKQYYTFAFQSISFFLKLPIIKIQIIYKATDFNFNASKFHQYCDNQPNLLMIAKTTTSKVFGGFTTQCWNIQNQNGMFGNYLTSNSIIISFSNRTVHRVKQKQKAIGNSANYGPIFGTADIIINNFNLQSICCFPLNYKIDENAKTTDPISLTGGQNFQLEEYQIYKVILK